MTHSDAECPDILVVSAATPGLVPRLTQRFTVHEAAPENDGSDVSALIAGRVRGLVTTSKAGATGGLIGALPRLEVISVSGGHVHMIDQEVVESRGIKVASTPGISTPDVADLVMSHLLSVARGIAASDRYLRAGRWATDGHMGLATQVSGKRLGIVGLGAIGSIVARRAEAFDLEVHYFGPRRKVDVSYRYHDDLVEMAAAVDFLVVTCVAKAETRHIIDEGVLAALGPAGFLINVTFGTADTSALIKALQTGAIAGAGIDVYDDAPNVPQEFLEMENVVLTSHIGSATRETRGRMAEQTIAALCQHFGLSMT
jgi:hydroxypyruvate reductase